MRGATIMRMGGEVPAAMLVCFLAKMKSDGVGGRCAT